MQSHAEDKHQALSAFRHQLPQLWAERPGQWVAYQGDKQIGFAARKHELYQLCFRQGRQADEFVVFCIEPEETEITLGAARDASMPLVIDLQLGRCTDSTFAPSLQILHAIKRR
jgi:hypothetical protein